MLHVWCVQRNGGEVISSTCPPATVLWTLITWQGMYIHHANLPSMNMLMYVHLHAVCKLYILSGFQTSYSWETNTYAAATTFLCKQAPKTWKHIAATVILLVRLWFMNNKNSGELDIIPKKNWKLMRQKFSKPMFATTSWQLLAPVWSPARPLKLRTLQWHHLLFACHVMVVQGENNQDFRGFTGGDWGPHMWSCDGYMGCCSSSFFSWESWNNKETSNFYES